ncbi:MAG: hypothetical protein LBT20_01380, partial [Clostridiales bacterium]|nr:hypothetical protein [Clostridiales bacterium]
MTKKKAKLQLIILSIVILLLTVAIVMPKGTQIFNSDYDYNGLWHDIKLGIDLKGGVYAVYNVEKNSDGDEVTDSAVAGTVDRLTRVLFNRGYTEATVVEQSSLGGTRQIRVEVPDVEDPQSLFDLLGRPALLEFKDPDNLDTVYVTGQNVTEAYAGYSGTDPVVVLKFDADGTTAFRDATTAKVG